MQKILYLVTEDWYFLSHRLALARAARDCGYEVIVATRLNNDAEKILSEGFRLVPLDMRRGEVSLGYELSTIVRLIKLIRQEKPVVVHNVALKPVILGTVAAKLAGISSVLNAVAGLGYVFTASNRKTAVLRSGIRLAFRFLLGGRNLRVIVQNDSDREILEQNGVAPQKIILIPGSGVDVNQFVPSPEDDGTPVAALVGRMLWPKGVRELVEAGRIVRESGRNVRIVLAGAPDPANPGSIDEGTLSRWDKSGLVEWRGLLSANEILSLWRHAHIGVLPSYYGEGVPKALLEAAACGRPLVATNTPGCRDVVIHEKTGLLVPPRDPKSLADAISRLIDDAELRARLGKGARQRAEAYFSMERVVEQTLSLYRSASLTA